MITEKFTSLSDFIRREIKTISRRYSPSDLAEEIGVSTDTALNIYIATDSISLGTLMKLSDVGLIRPFELSVISKESPSES